MLEKFIPDVYQKSIYTIDYKKLKSAGIKCILYDFDNTLLPAHSTKPTKKVKDLIERVKDMGFKVIIISNATKKRLTPIKDFLEVDCAAFAMKPRSIKYRKIMKEFKYAENEMASVGDQIFTDVYGGNRLGITTILVNPVSTKDHSIMTRVLRIIENIILNKDEKKQLFKKGQYYD
jgi:HAD superfamily phosphatase (TIGR01668 family)